MKYVTNDNYYDITVLMKCGGNDDHDDDNDDADKKYTTWVKPSIVWSTESLYVIHCIF